MNGFTSNRTITAHHSTMSPPMPSAGRMRRRQSRRRRAAAQARYSGSAGMAARPGTGVSMELVVMAASAGFQHAPQVGGEADEFGGLADVERPVFGQVDRHDLAHAAGVGGEHQHALAKEGSLVDAVRDEQDRHAGVFPDAPDFLVEPVPRDL